MPISGKCVDVDVDVHAFDEFEGSVFSICNVCEAEGLFTYMWDELEVRGRGVGKSFECVWGVEGEVGRGAGAVYREGSLSCFIVWVGVGMTFCG